MKRLHFVNRSKLKFVLVLLTSMSVNSQVLNTLEDYVRLSPKSLNYLKYEKNKSLSNNNEKLFAKKFLPDVSLDLKLPTYNRSISDVIQPDGSYAFRESNNANSNLRLTLRQKLPFSGGEISISNSISRLDIFGTLNDRTSYSASWLDINLSQPLTFFNPYKWEKLQQKYSQKITEINQKRDVKNLEYETTEFFFSILELNKKKELIEGQLSLDSVLTENIKMNVNAGRRLAIDSLENKLSILNKKQELISINFQLQLTKEKLKKYYNLQELTIDPLGNLKIPKFRKPKELKWFKNRYLQYHYIAKEYQLITLERDIVELRRKRYFDADLKLGLGFNNSSEDETSLFLNPNQSQNLSVGLSLPILNFRKKKIEYQNSLIKYEIQEINLIQQKDSDLYQIENIYNEILNFIALLKIEREKTILLSTKKKRAKILYEENRIMLRDLYDLENQYSENRLKEISLVKDIFLKLIELDILTII